MEANGVVQPVIGYGNSCGWTKTPIGPPLSLSQTWGSCLWQLIAVCVDRIG